MFSKPSKWGWGTTPPSLLRTFKECLPDAYNGESVWFARVRADLLSIMCDGHGSSLSEQQWWCRRKEVEGWDLNAKCRPFSFFAQNFILKLDTPLSRWAWELMQVTCCQFMFLHPIQSSVFPASRVNYR